MSVHPKCTAPHHLQMNKLSISRPRPLCNTEETQQREKTIGAGVWQDEAERSRRHFKTVSWECTISPSAGAATENSSNSNSSTDTLSLCLPRGRPPHNTRFLRSCNHHTLLSPMQCPRPPLLAVRPCNSCTGHMVLAQKFSLG